MLPIILKKCGPKTTAKIILYKTVVPAIRALTKDWPRNKGIKETLSIVQEFQLEKPTFLMINLMEVHEPMQYIPSSMRRKNGHKIRAFLKTEQ